MHISKEKLIAVIAASVLAGMILTTAVYFTVLRSSGMRLITSKEYAQLEAMDRRYEKLWTMQNKVRKNALNYVSVDKQMDSLYRALLNSYNDPYSVYMSE